MPSPMKKAVGKPNGDEFALQSSRGTTEWWMRRIPLCAMFTPTRRGAQCAPVSTDPYRTRLRVKKRVFSSLYTREPFSQTHSTLFFYLFSPHRHSLLGTPPLWRGFRDTKTASDYSEAGELLYKFDIMMFFQGRILKLSPFNPK